MDLVPAVKGLVGARGVLRARKMINGASCETLAASSFTYVLPQGICDAQAPEGLHSFTKTLHSPPEPAAASTDKMTPALRHVTKISSLSPKEIKGVLKLALEMKARPADYWDAPKRRTLLMCFAVHKSKLSSHPRHRCDACSIAWRCRFLTARRSQHGRVIAEK